MALDSDPTGGALQLIPCTCQLSTGRVVEASSGDQGSREAGIWGGNAEDRSMNQEV